MLPPDDSRHESIRCLIVCHLTQNYYSMNHVRITICYPLLQDRLATLMDIQERLLAMEERKLENSRLVRLLEEEVRKEQIRQSVKPSYNAYLLTREYK